MKLDFYETPVALTLSLRKIAQISGTVFEPAAGLLAISSCFKDDCKVITNDIDEARPTDYHFDATIESAWPDELYYDWCVTNPPYIEAEKILPIAFKRSTEGVAALLRLSYLEPTRRRGWWLQMMAPYLADLIVFNPRPKFRADSSGSDSMTAAWFIWKRSRAFSDPGTRIHYIDDWKDARLLLDSKDQP
jgi:hypothetical protein